MNMKASDFFLSKAEESFAKEQKLYSGTIFTNLNKLMEGIENYEEFQNTLIEKAFGKNYSFLFSFCDNSFIHKIITTGTGNIKKVFFKNGENTLAVLREQIAEGKSAEGDIAFSGLYDLTSLDYKERNAAISNIASIVAEKTFNELVDASIIEIQKNYQDSLKNQFQNTLKEAFSNFGYRYEEKGGSGAKKNQQTGDYELLYLTTSQEGLTIKRGKQSKIFFDQDDLLSILKTALQKLPDKVDGMKKYNSLKINLTTAKNEFLVTFEKENNNKIDKIEDKIAQVFFNVVSASLSDENQKQDFESFWVNKGKESFKKLGKDKLKKLLLSNTEAAVSGELGEIMVAIFLDTLPKEQQRNVAIFGQTQGATGDAAVDIGLKIIEKEITQIGFQVKNYTSIQDNLSLYTQSSDLMADDITRYLTKEFTEEFRTDIREINPFQEKEEEEAMSKNLIGLINHIPYFLRYDEAEGKAEEVKDYQNNFYIINFRIIPASIIFKKLSEIVASEEKKVESQKKFFYLSSEKQIPERGNILKSQDFKKTYINTHKNFILTEKKKFYVNFIGIKIKFRQALDILIK